MLRPLLTLPLLICLSASAPAAGEFHLPVRLGLFGSPGFRQGGAGLSALTESGWIAGTSTIASTPAAWVRNPADGVTRRVGLYTGEGYGNDSQGSQVELVTETGWLRGVSRHFPPAVGGVGSLIPWVADGTTGRTWPGGLDGPEYRGDWEIRESEIRLLTRSGYAWGVSARPRAVPERDPAPWVMDGRTGAVHRAGLHDGPLHTQSGTGRQRAEGRTFTESGWLFGESDLYDGSRSAGQAVWATQAATGLTRRMGFHQEAEYTRGGEFEQYSVLVKAVESGWAAGTSRRYPAGDSPFHSVVSWAENVAGGGPRGIGVPEGGKFTNAATGEEFSGVLRLTEAGWAAGFARVYSNGEGGGGEAVWVQDIRAAGPARRVGLFQGPEFAGGSPYSRLWTLTESGWAGGESRRFRHPSGPGGQAVWVARAATGEVRRVGFTGGRFRDIYQEEHSALDGVTESGWVTGRSRAYEGGSDAAGVFGKGDVLWVAHASDGVARRMGLSGGEFISFNGYSFGEITGVTESGTVFGHTNTFRGEREEGRAAWAGDAATGAVTRVGLTGEGFTSPWDGTRTSVIQGWTQSGFVHGYSRLYHEDGSNSHIPWVADAATGLTHQAGPPGEFRDPEDGVFPLTESGLAAGGTRVPSGSYVAWVLDAKSGSLTTFVLSTREPDGHSYSFVSGITSAGVVYGGYSLYPADTGFRAFLWAEGLGTLVAGGPWEGEPGSGGGYEYVHHITVNARGVIVGNAHVPGEPFSQSGLFLGSVPGLAAPGGGVGVTDLARLPDGKYRLSFHTDAAVRITLQSSADLTTWTDGQTIDAPAGASHMDIDPAPAAGPNRYWRLKTAPASP